MRQTNKRKSAAFIDLDLTILDVDSFRYFLKQEYLLNFRHWHYLPTIFIFGILRKIRVISLQNFKEKAFISLRGKDKKSIEEIGKDFFKKDLKNRIRDKAIEKVKYHKSNNELVFILSASPDIYIYPIAQFLECTDYQCSTLSYERNRFVGTFDGRDCLGDEKLKRMKQLSEIYSIDLSSSFAYSDNESDLPILEAVGNPIPITPSNKLRKVAVKSDWKIENW